ncbi:MAG: hypothetical protein KJ798_10855 [Gammaproteobacteria bacterium]|nr:hypothetical protein [Gammaproteobacteria bacterium]MBU0850162.1 hypothetical protein [Gammaproteobacteria bacterium]MBU1268650.1 hypothetical protein [Gammaproteobacteria bacterium]MBU1528016.1 hypothetical protein [Gammaproteobacteria bacterium]MBU1780867.1 hypothetical protein [Gammaproteobacteria bacterium]
MNPEWNHYQKTIAACCVLFSVSAFAAPPSEASLNELLVVTNAQRDAKVNGLYANNGAGPYAPNAENSARVFGRTEGGAIEILAYDPVYLQGGLPSS